MGFRVRRRRTSAFRGVAGHNPLSDINSAAEFDIYPVLGATEQQINIIESPASGAGQTLWDFPLGNDDTEEGVDPTPTDASPDYLAFDGGDYMKNPSFITFEHSWHRDGSGLAGLPVTIGICLRTPASFTVGSILGNATSGSNKGIVVGWDASGNFRLNHRSPSNFWTFTGNTLSVSTNYILMIAWDFDTINTAVEGWIGSGTGVTNTDSTAGNNTGNPSGDLHIGAKGDSLQILTNGTRIYNIFALNKVINDTEAAAIITHYESELGIDLTP